MWISSEMIRCTYIRSSQTHLESLTYYLYLILTCCGDTVSKSLRIKGHLRWLKSKFWWEEMKGAGFAGFCSHAQCSDLAVLGWEFQRWITWASSCGGAQGLHCQLAGHDFIKLIDSGSFCYEISGESQRRRACSPSQQGDTWLSNEALSGLVVVTELTLCIQYRNLLTRLITKQ